MCDLAYVTLLDDFLVTFKLIAKETVKDKTLGKVIEFTKDGWPSKVKQELSNYLLRRNEISVVQNCLIWNNRVIIPECFQEKFKSWKILQQMSLWTPLQNYSVVTVFVTLL